MNNQQIISAIESTAPKSAWKRAVKDYAIDILESLEAPNQEFQESALLNGAENWRAYPYGGSALIYDDDIARRVCSPSEFKRSREGQRNPSGSENWLDCQARALFHAARLIKSTADSLA